jgi:hypothetical protein
LSNFLVFCFFLLASRFHPAAGTTAVTAAIEAAPGPAVDGIPQTPEGVPEDVLEESDEEPEMASEPVSVPEVVPEEVPV